ncbi:hypothetical protein FrEUN1fDRAFT_2985 [Parafrankia sp. EUN1f]|nr:hypothetical protein FrEUN1fDRAFT_2985 [Parafrankia sp. EUN1f]
MPTDLSLAQVLSRRRGYLRFAVGMRGLPVLPCTG